MLTKLNNPFGHTNTGNLITCESEIAFTAHLYSRFDGEHLIFYEYLLFPKK